MDKLIFDRTATDVEYARNNPSADEWLKGCYNYIDLNRVEEWCEYLSNLLNSYGYVNLISVKTDWNIKDIQTVEQMERYLNNVKALMQAFVLKQDTPKAPTTMNKLRFTEANNIEKILYDIDLLIKSMQKHFIYSGVASLGQNRTWQNRFRRPPKTLGDGYTRLQYIESTKTQWIDTNYYVKYGDVVTVDMAFLDTQSYFGYYKANTDRFGVGVAKGAYEMVNGSNSSIWKPVSDTERHTFVIDTTGQMKLDDTVQTVTAMATDFVAGYSFALFGRKQSATNTSYRGNHRLYGFKVESNSKLIMNLVPAKIDSDGTIGLYDTVSGDFFYNKGTGAFAGE